MADPMCLTDIPVSVLILTRNEAADLPDCLCSVRWCNDVHVFDSGSSDDTIAIAQAHGAIVTERTYPHTDAPFGGDEAAHRNWALRHLPFKHEWVLVLDADERCTPALMTVLQRIDRTEHNVAAYRLLRRDHFLGTWIRHVTPSPYHIRLIRPSRVQYERVINPVTVVDGDIGEMAAWFDHFPFSKGLSHWFAKHNGYSSAEARHILNTRGRQCCYSVGKALFARDVNVRRVHQKGLYYRLPLRPLIMFMGLYVGKRGFLDGRAGLVYATLRAIYEYMITLKVNELESAFRERP